MLGNSIAEYSRAFNPSSRSKKKDLENGSKNTKFVLVLSATINEIDKPLVEAIVEHLRQISGDTSLTLRKIESGSVRLILEGSQDGFERLELLFREGQLAEILGIAVQDIQYIIQEQHSIPEGVIQARDSDLSYQAESITSSSTSQPFQKLHVEPSQYLQLLTEEAKQFESWSPQRQRTLDRLVDAILRSNLLIRPQRSLIPTELYEDLYSEAIQETLLQVCQRIQDYDPDRSSVIAWVNYLLAFNFKAIAREYEELKYGRITAMSLEVLDNFASDANSSSEPELIESLRNLLHEDLESRFSNVHLKGHPEVTFQALVLARLDGQSWEQLSRRLSVPITTLAAFYHRQFKSLVSYFKAYLQE